MMSPESPRNNAACFGAIVGLVMALAANLTATWPQGAVMIGTGVAAPVVLPLVLWIRSTFRVKTVWERIFREVAVAAVAAPAAALSYWHTLTLVEHHVPAGIAFVLPLSADGVALMSTMALHHFRASAPVSKLEPQVEPVVSKPPVSTPVAVSVRPTAAPVPHTTPATAVSRAPAVAAPSTIESKCGQVAERVAWLEARRKAWPGEKRERPVDEVAALIARFGGSESTAKRTRREVDEAQDRAAA